MLRLRLSRFIRPPCAVCGLAPGPVCSGCEADFFPATRQRCAVCGIAMDVAAAACGRCVLDPPAFHRTTALADYAPPVDGMVMALKFRAHLELGAVFGGLFAGRVTPAPGAVVVAVPLAFERMAERGFNQSQQIARAFCRASGATPAPGLVCRVRHAPPQQALALADRRRNIRGAFRMTGDVSGREVLVVDDVMTSGSTMNEVARLLVSAGARLVHALVVARTP